MHIMEASGMESLGAASRPLGPKCGFPSDPCGVHDRRFLKFGCLKQRLPRGDDMNPDPKSGALVWYILYDLEYMVYRTWYMGVSKNQGP